MTRFLLALLLIAFAFPAFSEDHPNETLYVYAKKQSLGYEPVVAERIHWRCYDAKFRDSVSCGYFRGSLRQFDYIYRGKVASQKPLDLCALLALDHEKLRYDARVTSESMKLENSCNLIQFYKGLLLFEELKRKLEDRYFLKGCGAREPPADAYSRIDQFEADLKRSQEDCQTELKEAREERNRKKERSSSGSSSTSASRPSTSGSSSSSSGSSELFSSGRIECFGGCRQDQVIPRGRNSTITSSKFGDTPGPGKTEGQKGYPAQ